jgi:hypothetical protein
MVVVVARVTFDHFRNQRMGPSDQPSTGAQYTKHARPLPGFLRLQTLVLPYHIPEGLRKSRILHLVFIHPGQHIETVTTSFIEQATNKFSWARAS